MNIAEPKFGSEEIELLKKCLDSKWVTQGPFVSEFELLFARRHRCDYALATTSCTAALHLATLALGLSAGDEVIVPAFTWVTSAHCAEYVGAKVVFADIDLATFNLDPVAVEAAITPRTKAIVAVHLFGLPAPMDELRTIAKKYSLFIIEDGACAVGSEYKGVPVGAIGDIGCFSLHPRKVITTGEGGVLTTNVSELAEKLKSLRNHGATGLPPGVDPSRAYAMSTFKMLGFNLRLSDIQAAVGVAQMGRLDSLLEDRHTCAKRYDQLLSEVVDLILPMEPEWAYHSYQSYVVRLASGGKVRRNAVMDELTALGIQTRPGTHAVHRLDYYAEKYGILPSAFPNACKAEDTTITLPIIPDMSEVQQSFVTNALIGALKHQG